LGEIAPDLILYGHLAFSQHCDGGFDAASMNYLEDFRGIRKLTCYIVF